jgi:hypothetical protein
MTEMPVSFFFNKKMKILVGLERETPEDREIITNRNPCTAN